VPPPGPQSSGSKFGRQAGEHRQIPIRPPPGYRCTYIYISLYIHIAIHSSRGRRGGCCCAALKDSAPRPWTRPARPAAHNSNGASDQSACHWGAPGTYTLSSRPPEPLLGGCMPVPPEPPKKDLDAKCNPYRTPTNRGCRQNTKLRCFGAMDVTKPHLSRGGPMQCVLWARTGNLGLSVTFWQKPAPESTSSINLIYTQVRGHFSVPWEPGTRVHSLIPGCCWSIH
jgi:hypothetical protein